jgi:lincosamide nucleotidyltransferase A/C/D/E
LLGRQTRDHDDLDLVVRAGLLPMVHDRLADLGCTLERDRLPAALALRHCDGRAVDLHPIEPT